MKRRNEVLVGILITAAVVIGVVGTVWLVRGGLRSGYSLYSVFGWDAAELKVGQPVRLAGVQVGFIKDVALRDNGTLVVSMDIEKGRRVPRNARAVAEAGRATHRAWCARVFAPALPGPDAPAYAARLDAFVAATDLSLWKLLRRDLGRSAAETKAVLLALLRGDGG